MDYQNIKVTFKDNICFLQFYRPDANNTINGHLVNECLHVLEICKESVTIIVVEGLPEVFCFGADFQDFQGNVSEDSNDEYGPDSLYQLWLDLATGPYITISHVRGKANAGGMGFVAASDIVLADKSAQFSLSELLFGLFPACVLPFLIKKIGFQKSNYMTLMTKPVSVQEAHAWGLVDEYDIQSDSLVRKHLLRLRHLSKRGILRYKRYMSELQDSLTQSRSLAVASNKEIFSDPVNQKTINRYVEKGLFPWEN